jgi:hypothetical protein
VAASRRRRAYIAPGDPSLTVSQSHRAQILVSSDRIAQNDARTSWEVNRYKLTQYHHVLHKTCLPKEWSLKDASIPAKETFCMEVYHWVRDNYDPIGHPLHALTMFVSFIFSGLLPFAFPLTSIKPPKACLDALPNLAAFIANLLWEARSKKGTKEINPFVTMVSTFVIAFMDERSLLARDLEDDRENMKQFLEKHSECASERRVLMADAPDTASKGITVLNVLVRFRLVTLLTSKCIRAGRWKHDFGPISEEELQAKWDNIKRCVSSDEQYGTYNAVVDFTGETMAKRLLENNWLQTRGHVERNPFTIATQASQSKKALGKRRQMDVDVDASSD